MNQDNLVTRPLRPGEIDVLRKIEKSVRSRYRTLQGFAPVVDSPAIARERFASGDTVVAEWRGGPAGFVLTQILDGLLYITNISVAPDAAGQGIGRMLLEAAEDRAAGLRLPAVTLATFKSPLWNGPWFRRCGYQPMPDERIGAGLKAILDRQAEFMDRSTRETLWKRIDTRP